MTALDDALARVKSVKQNALNLADPDVAEAEAELAFKEAVVAALGGGVPEAEAVTPFDPSELEAKIAALAAENVALKGSVAAVEAAAAAIGQALQHPVAAPFLLPQPVPTSSELAPAVDSEAPPTIAPSNTGV